MPLLSIVGFCCQSCSMLGVALILPFQPSHVFLHGWQVYVSVVAYIGTVSLHPATVEVDSLLLVERLDACVDINAEPVVEQ